MATKTKQTEDDQVNEFLGTTYFYAFDPSVIKELIEGHGGELDLAKLILDLEEANYTTELSEYLYSIVDSKPIRTKQPTKQNVAEYKNLIYETFGLYFDIEHDDVHKGLSRLTIKEDHREIFNKRLLQAQKDIAKRIEVITKKEPSMFLNRVELAQTQEAIHFWNLDKNIPIVYKRGGQSNLDMTADIDVFDPIDFVEFESAPKTFFILNNFVGEIL